MPLNDMMLPQAPAANSPSALMQMLLSQIAATPGVPSRGAPESFPSSIAQPPMQNYGEAAGPPAPSNLIYEGPAGPPAPGPTVDGWEGRVEPTSAGAMMDPTMQAPQPQQQHGGLLEDPVNRAALLSFGLAALSGGGDRWGSDSSRLAGAIGNGVESAAGAAAYADEQRRAADKTRLAEEELTQRDRLNREDNESAERRTKMITDQRLATAGSGGSSNTLERQRRQFASRAYEGYKNNILNASQTPEEKEAGAREAWAAALEQYDSEFAGAGTSPNPANGEGPLSTPGVTPAPGKTTPNAAPPRGAPNAAPANLKPLSSRKLSPVALQKAIAKAKSDPAFRARMISEGYNPDA